MKTLTTPQIIVFVISLTCMVALTVYHIIENRRKDK